VPAGVTSTCGIAHDTCPAEALTSVRPLEVVNCNPEASVAVRDAFRYASSVYPVRFSEPALAGTASLHAAPARTGTGRIIDRANVA
jgi:hypothetical protein